MTALVIGPGVAARWFFFFFSARRGCGVVVGNSHRKRAPGRWCSLPIAGQAHRNGWVGAWALAR